jgi:DNA-binding response OmpR family regulator
MTDRKTILVVDDDPNISLFCRTVLSASGYQVYTAGSAKEGLALALSETPDLVILDIMMEEVDSGFQVARKLAAEKPDLPILMLSSIAGASSNVFDVTELPVAQLIDKPIDPDMLIKKVAKLLS